MITIIYLEYCPYSIKALQLLKKYKLKYNIINVNNNNKETIKKKYNIKTFPNIMLNTTINKQKKILKIGGCDDMIRLILG